MDKQKTGKLIKEARLKQHYTQSELGDLLGVSNKAVSRWENGDSFPDVGILEQLASVLDVRIQDIITGETGLQDETLVTEVVRVAKLQQKEKKRNLIKNSTFLAAILCCIFSGYLALSNSNLFFADDSIVVYVIFMVCSFTLTVAGCKSQVVAENHTPNTFYHCTKIISVLSFVWCIAITGCMFLLILSGHIPFEMTASSVGPFINWQLIVLFVLNLALTILELYRYIKKEETIHRTWFLSVATMYLSILYSNMLHQLSSLRYVMSMFATRTLFVSVALGITLIVAKMIQKGNLLKTESESPLHKNNI